MANIYVVNYSGHNINPSKKFLDAAGQIFYLTEGTINIFNIDRVIYDMKARLKNFNESDFLLLSGNVVLNVIATLIIKDKVKHLKLLIWDAREDVRNYKLRTINTKLLRGE